MKALIKELWLVVTLITAASLLLLASDWGQRTGSKISEQKYLDAQSPAAQKPLASPVSKMEAGHPAEPRAEPAKSAPHTPWQLRMVLYSETEFAERSCDGLIDGIKQAGLVEGQDYKLKIYNAQGDMSTLSSIMNTVKSDKPDLLMTISTATLQAALRQAGPETKIIFTAVADAVQAGAGKSETEHLPNVTGVTTRSPIEGMARIIRETLPGAKAVGTLFTPAELNSVLFRDWFKAALEQEGIQLVAIPVTSSADVAQSAADLCTKGIQALAQIHDNLTQPGTALIARKAAESNLPVYVFESAQMKDNVVICLARDYYQSGLETAVKAVRVLRGESPGDIPFNSTQSEKLLVNYELARKYNLTLPESLTAKATPYTPKQP